MKAFALRAHIPTSHRDEETCLEYSVWYKMGSRERKKRIIVVRYW